MLSYCCRLDNKKEKEWGGVKLKKENIFLKIWRIIYMPIVYFTISLIVSVVAMIFMGILVGIEAGYSGSIDLIEMEEKIYALSYRYAMLFSLIAAVLTIPICYFLMKKDKKREFLIEGEIRYEKVSYTKYIPVIILGFASCIGINNLISISGLIELFPGYLEVAEAIYGGGIFLQILSVVIIIPILEELLFRGIVYKRLRGYININAAILISALIFGIFHMNVVQGLYAFMIGILLAYIYENYKSIWAPIIFHISANGVSVFLTEVVEKEGIFDNTLFFIIITILTLVLTVFLTVWIGKQINPTEKRMDRSVFENV